MASEQGRALALGLLGSYPGRQIGELNVEAIAHALDQLDPETAVNVCSLLQRRSSDPPSVAQVYEASREIEKQTPTPPLRSLPPRIPQPTMVTRVVTEPSGETMLINEHWLRDRERMTAQAERPVRPRPPACSGAGHAPVRKDSKWVCPDCGVEVR